MLDTEGVEGADEEVLCGLDVCVGVVRTARHLVGGDHRGGVRGYIVVIVAAGGECQGSRQCDGAGCELLDGHVSPERQQTLFSLPTPV
ncbi:hypothetical protein [Corynebacterium variabile]|uniref:hypothetical protein n=1 Tax=Corynebacterium variabile TaxID=1727 RepID=UPI0028AA65A5|nr:hypothetical protein [Corynebacterium variabile]